MHRELGPRLLESAYRECLCHEVKLRGLRFEYEIPLPVQYKGVRLDCGYRLDIVVEDQVILELKTVEKLLPIHEAQLLTYFKAEELPPRPAHQLSSLSFKRWNQAHRKQLLILLLSSPCLLVSAVQICR